MMHIDGFVRGRGRFMIAPYVPTEEKTGARYPAAAHDRAYPLAV